MFTSSPFGWRFQTSQNRMNRPVGMAWLLMAPGLFLIFMALAILVWPELLAYLVAGALLFAGISLLTWGWTMQRAQRSARQRTTYVTYDIS
ncbi:MAG: hypothetical protein KDE19_03065 [Caldilineaceae bacterium]|nr:hypothetical protein [Caldilineaceae bacterium]